MTVHEALVSDLTLRPGRPDDAARCGQICYEAFRSIASRHGFPPPIPSVEVATALLTSVLSHPRFYKVVAERNGDVVGSNFLDERSVIAGVGPITVDPGVQDRGIGRRLMQDVLDRATSRGVAGVRLVQAGYHMRSLSLYTRLGFVVREPLACMQGSPIATVIPGRTVRPAGDADLDGCNRVCRAVHGHDRAGELTDAIKAGTATVVEHAGRITGYATAVAFFGHTVGGTPDDVMALIGAAPSFGGPGILVPTRSPLFAWCLDRGLQVKEPLTLMSLGLYNEPAGAFLPSILF